MNGSRPGIAGRLWVAVSVLVALTMCVSACGYHLSGTGAIVPEGAKYLAIPVFFNATNEPYVDVELTQAVVEEFMTDGRLKVVSLEDADLALHGKIVKYEAVPLSYHQVQKTEQYYVQQYRVHVVIEASLEDIRAKKVLWKENAIESSFISDYAVSFDAADRANISATRVAKDAAIKKAGQDIAWTLRSRVLEGF